MRDANFEWDDEKARENVTRHDITFETARRAFDDPNSLSYDDDRENYGEDRYNLLGYVDLRLLHVTYTYRGDRIRIISARGAERREYRQYHEARRQAD